MKKNTTAKKRASTQAKGSKQAKTTNQRLTIGLDLGDLTCRYLKISNATL